ncbi:MAG: VOC family protein [Acidimicrobiales bacterium]
MPDVSSIVLFSAQPDRTIAFYRSVGIEFAYEDHGDGLLHAAADVGDVHVAVFSALEGGVAPGWRAGGSTFFGFYVDSLEETLAMMSQMGATVLVGHQIREWGCRVVVEDPDGRAVEVSQRGHCGAVDTA